MNSTVKPHSIVLSKKASHGSTHWMMLLPWSVWSSDGHGVIVRTAVTRVWRRENYRHKLIVQSSGFTRLKTELLTMWLLQSARLDTSLEWWEKRTSAENCLHQGVLLPCVWGIFLIASCCRKTQPTMGGDIARQGIVQGSWAVFLRGLFYFYLQPPALNSCPGFPQWWIVL